MGDMTGEGSVGHPSGWKATDGMCTRNQLSKRSRHAVSLEKP